MFPRFTTHPGPGAPRSPCVGTACHTGKWYGQSRRLRESPFTVVGKQGTTGHWLASTRRGALRYTPRMPTRARAGLRAPGARNVWSPTRPAPALAGAGCVPCPMSYESRGGCILCGDARPVGGGRLSLPRALRVSLSLRPPLQTTRCRGRGPPLPLTCRWRPRVVRRGPTAPSSAVRRRTRSPPFRAVRFFRRHSFQARARRWRARQPASIAATLARRASPHLIYRARRWRGGTPSITATLARRTSPHQPRATLARRHPLYRRDAGAARLSSSTARRRRGGNPSIAATLARRASLSCTARDAGAAAPIYRSQRWRGGPLSRRDAGAARFSQPRRTSLALLLNIPPYWAGDAVRPPFFFSHWGRERGRRLPILSLLSSLLYIWLVPSRTGRPRSGRHRE